MDDLDTQAAGDAAVRHDAREPGGKPSFTVTDGGGADPTHQHSFHLAGVAPSRFHDGDLRGAVADNWSVLKGQQDPVDVGRLASGGVRELHWHPSSRAGSAGAWSSRAAPAMRSRARAGDLVFAPQGHFHYFENASDTEDLVVLIVFNTSVAGLDDGIGLVESLSAIPPGVLGAIFGVPADTFKAVPKNHDRVVIALKRKEPANG